MLTKISDHGPYSNELDWHGGAKGPLERVGELLVVGGPVEFIGKCDLLVVVSWQQADLLSGNGGRRAKLRLVLLGLVLNG